MFSSELKKVVGIVLGIRFNRKFMLKSKVSCYLSVSDNGNDVYRGGGGSSRLYILTKEEAMNFLLIKKGIVYRIFK